MPPAVMLKHSQLHRGNMMAPGIRRIEMEATIDLRIGNAANSVPRELAERAGNRAESATGWASKKSTSFFAKRFAVSLTALRSVRPVRRARIDPDVSHQVSQVFSMAHSCEALLHECPKLREWREGRALPCHRIIEVLGKLNRDSLLGLSSSQGKYRVWCWRVGPFGVRAIAQCSASFTNSRIRNCSTSFGFR